MHYWWKFQLVQPLWKLCVCVCVCVCDEAAAIPAETWFALSRWAKETKNFLPWQRSLLFSVGSLVGRGQKPSIKQATHAMKAYKAAFEKGFTV